MALGMADQVAAEIAHRAGVGAEVNLTLGGHSRDEPFEALYRVEELHHGRFDATGPFYKGAAPFRPYPHWRHGCVQQGADGRSGVVPIRRRRANRT